MNHIKHYVSFIVDDSKKLPKGLRQKLLVLSQAIFGLLWLEAAAWKVRVDGNFAINTDGFKYWVEQGIEHPVIGLYTPVLENIILPNITAFLVLVFIAELVIGILFIAGRYVRMAAALAFFQTIAITLSAINAENEWHWSYFLMLLVSALLFLVPTRSQWLDKLLKR